MPVATLSQGRPTRRSRRLPASLVLAQAVFLALPATARSQETAVPAEPWLVMPFENPSREPRAYWLTEGASVLLTDDLAALGQTAVRREERLAAFDWLQVPPIASLSYATVIRVGQVLGVARIAVGSLTLAGDRLEVRARSIRLDAGSLQPEVVESGPLDDLFAIFERLARRMVQQSGGTAASRLPGHPSPGAFENYIKGLMAGTTASQVNYLEAALKMDPGFDRARLALWAAHREGGAPERALAAVSAVPRDSPWHPQARFAASLSQIQLKRYDAAFTTLRALAELSAGPAVLNNLGVVQLRRSVTAAATRPADYFSKAASADPGDPDYAFNAGYACWLDRDFDGAIRWLREAVRGNPADWEAHGVLAAALHSAGTDTEAGREREIARQLSSGYAAWERPQGGGEPVPRGLERIKQDLDARRSGGLDSVILAAKQRDQSQLADFYLDRGRRLFEQKQDREAEGELRRALYLAPYRAEAHLLLGRILLRTSRTREAIDAFKISLWSSETVAAHLDLAEAYVQSGDVAAARAEAQRALSLEPDSAETLALLARLGRQQGAK